MNELHSVYLTTLAKMWNIESKLIFELSALASSVKSYSLKTALLNQLEETKMQKERIEEICIFYKFDPRGRHDDSFNAFISENREELSTISDEGVKDAFILASVQALEHMQIAKYASLVEWSRELEDDESFDLLRQSLYEEEAADRRLKSIGKGGLFRGGINRQAVKYNREEAILGEV